MTETANLEMKADVSIDDAGTVTGIAWPFGKPDSYGDLIEPTAFRFAAEVPMLLEHEQRQVVGIWNSYAVTDKGLEVKGRLFVEGIGPARHARQQLKAGTMSGLSIGYRLHEHKARPEGGRVLTDLTITEISLCRRPVHPDARTIEVKSIIEGKPMENELENAPEAKADPVVTAEEIKALKSDIATLKAKLNRPTAANNNQPNGENDNSEQKAFFNVLRKGEARIADEERKALTVAEDATAGYLAPEQFGSELIKLLKEFNPIRQYARVVSIGAKEIKYPRRIGSPTAFWVSETEDRTHSEPAYAQISITPHELATYTDVSNQLLEDNAYNLEGELATEFAEAFATTEALAFLKGTGNANYQPVGLLTNASVEAVTTGDAAGFPASSPADVLIGMFHHLPTAHAQRGVWMMNRNTLAEIRKWKDGEGNYLVANPISEGMPTTLLGRPVIECLDMDDIEAGKTPIVFGDLQGYRIIDRIQLSVLRDPYTLATKGQVRFHARRRTGGDVTHPDRFVKLQVAA
ncbi:phage major capsid protein [Pseudorhizobium endolithicum]|uniref:Phage major capsid protein n=2 Tax=Pseudorhizobium endolithicum TaxID=1191678 RepID=A0ABM8PFI3_9HYPH|nr:phage major capsid protein [Pseudorhizobium endolithicum]